LRLQQLTCVCVCRRGVVGVHGCHHPTRLSSQALIAEVSPSQRKPSSEAFVTRLNDARLAHTLRHVDFIFGSLFYIGDYPLTLKIFKAEHYFFHEFVRSFPDRVVVSFASAAKHF
jgi:hypothetical protein